MFSRFEMNTSVYFYMDAKRESGKAALACNNEGLSLMSSTQVKILAQYFIGFVYLCLGGGDNLCFIDKPIGSV